MSVRDVLRRWLGVAEPAAPEAQDTSRSLHAINRQLAEFRGLIHQQSDFTVEALRRAGWQGEEDVAQQEALRRALAAVRGEGDVIVGPWTGEVGFELMYWIPFLGWLAEQGLMRAHEVGNAVWYDIDTIADLESAVALVGEPETA